MAKQATGHRGNSTRLVLVGLAVGLAGFLYGMDTGIIASTIAHTSFKSYMYGPSLKNSSLQGAFVSVYYAGYAAGSGSAGYLMDRISRRWALFLGCCISVVGTAIQSAAQGPSMMLVGRVLGGVASGMVYPTAPVYLAELAPPENRGFLVGLKGLMNTIGFFVAGWVGYAGSFANGNVQWRVPLATQAPPAILMATLMIFCPYSPRWLAMQERYEAAEQVMHSLHSHRDAGVIEEEFAEMCVQIRREASVSKWQRFAKLFTRQYARRLLLACLIVNMQKLSGSSIIQNYQTVMYTALGYESEALLITAIYGIMALVGQLINVFFVADHWTRRKTVITGCYTLAGILIVVMALSRFYPDAHNLDGSRAGVAFIFMFSFAYSFFFNSIFWVLVAEIFPLELRAAGVGFSVFTQSITAIWLSYASSLMFANITWRTFFVFIACNLFAGTMFLLFLPETRFLSLEEVAVKFGDDVVPREVARIEMKTEREDAAAMAEKAQGSAAHVETAAR